MLGFLRRIPLTQWIIIATILGALVGWLDHDVWLNANVGDALKPLSNIFLRMIKSIVVPTSSGWAASPSNRCSISKW
jgi:proton glutamate symport protein